MTEIPKRIRITFNKDWYPCLVDGKVDVATLNERYPENAPYTEHYYTLEDKQMEQEKEKAMTAQDAWIAMALGKCVESGVFIHKIKDSVLLFWYRDTGEWRATHNLGGGPYSIVPDPSKPVDEYETQKKDLLKLYEPYPGDVERARKVLEFIDSKYQRKEAK